MTSIKLNTFILDTTAFIGLDFPVLQTWQNALFFTTSTVVSELKDIRSKMNLDILIQSGKLKIDSTNQELFKEIKKRIKKIDPQTSLSAVDMDILVLSQQLKGTLITNDLALQNIAYSLNIPTRIISGKKINQVRKWVLKCKNCGKKSDAEEKQCSECGGSFRRVTIKTLMPNSED